VLCSVYFLGIENTMNKSKDEILQKLHDFLLEKKSIPIRDAAKIILPEGVIAEILQIQLKNVSK